MNTDQLSLLKVEDFREDYNQYFREFNRLAVGDFADMSYGNDKPNDTASSLESIIAYANYINRSPKIYEKGPIILNAGAGASSWMFRKLFDDVICADPNKRYLELIQKICSENNLRAHNFQEHMLVSASLYGRVDHVYFDYGDIERLPYLGSAIDAALFSIYVDDVDNRPGSFPYRQMVIDLCKKLNLKWFDCTESLDSHGRAGIIIEK